MNLNMMYSAVALHPEGVDRNLNKMLEELEKMQVALHPEGVDRNAMLYLLYSHKPKSPSTRRAWIEMKNKGVYFYGN